MVLILAQALRVVTFIVTTLPGPSEQCRPDSQSYNPPRDLYEVFFGITKFSAFGVGCGDLVFSSAMIFVLLCALTLQHYADDTPLLNAIKRFVWLLTALFGLAQIASRTVYTLDILVASYTVPLLWVACLRHVPDHVPAEFKEELHVPVWSCFCDPKSPAFNGATGSPAAITSLLTASASTSTSISTPNSHAASISVSISPSLSSSALSSSSLPLPALASSVANSSNVSKALLLVTNSAQA